MEPRVVGFTNGVFDLMHQGHRLFLDACRNRCELLYIAVNSDASTRALKGPERPVDHESSRLSSVRQYSPFSFLFDSEEDLKQMISHIGPTFIFKGSDYEGKEVVGSDIARVVLIPRLPGFSTTEEIAKRRA